MLQGTAEDGIVSTAKVVLPSVNCESPDKATRLATASLQEKLRKLEAQWLLHKSHSVNFAYKDDDEQTSTSSLSSDSERLDVEGRTQN